MSFSLLAKSWNDEIFYVSRNENGIRWMKVAASDPVWVTMTGQNQFTTRKTPQLPCSIIACCCKNLLLRVKCNAVQSIKLTNQQSGPTALSSYTLLTTNLPDVSGRLCHILTNSKNTLSTIHSRNKFLTNHVQYFWQTFMPLHYLVKSFSTIRNLITNFTTVEFTATFLV